MPREMRITKNDWLTTGREVCFRHRLNDVRFFAGDRKVPYSRARWEAWRDLHARGYGYYEIGKISGFDHTSVRHAVLAKHIAYNFMPTDLRKFFPQPHIIDVDRVALAVARRDAVMRAA